MSGRKRRNQPPITARGSSNPKHVFNLPPLKIIKATIDHFSTKTGELSFKKGDFFYVINEREDTFEVINPILQIRGVVHQHCFQNINRNADQNAESAQYDQYDDQARDYLSNAQRPYSTENHSNPISQNRYQSSQISPSQYHPRSTMPGFEHRPAFDSLYQSEYDFGAPEPVVEPVPTRSYGRHDTHNDKYESSYNNARNDAYGDDYEDNYNDEYYGEVYNDYDDNRQNDPDDDKFNEDRFEDYDDELDDRYNPRTASRYRAASPRNEHRGYVPRSERQNRSIGHERPNSPWSQLEAARRSPVDDLDHQLRALKTSSPIPRGTISPLPGSRGNPIRVHHQQSNSSNENYRNGRGQRSDSYGSHRNDRRGNSGEHRNDRRGNSGENYRSDRSRGNGKYPDSKISERKPSDDEILACTVVHFQQVDRKWTFSIHVEYHGGKLDVLKRSYDDIWALQVTLLSWFPLESGRENEPRSIPFLTPPNGEMTIQDAQRTRFDLNRYLNELVQLPPSVLYSVHVARFFAIRRGDEANAQVNFDAADTLLDLLEDYQTHTDLIVKLVRNKDIIQWKIDAQTSYDELIEEATAKLGFRFANLMYLDETEQMIPLRGDQDFRLLTSMKKLKFFVS